VVIVLGVLAALAVEEWREELKLAEQREHTLESLLVDLREDREDYLHFAENQQARSAAATYLTTLANDVTGELPREFQNAGEALHFLAITARLQTTRSAVQEISSTGTMTAIPDAQLRARIMQYYALATDRSAVNDFIDPEIQRYRAALERLGISYSDGKNIDSETALRDKSVSALIRSMGAVAAFAPLYCSELVDLNAALISELEAILSER
jgi:Arc/MetJ family transcription regulator